MLTFFGYSTGATTVGVGAECCALSAGAVATVATATATGFCGEVDAD
jgi:hypothetical protein